MRLLHYILINFFRNSEIYYYVSHSVVYHIFVYAFSFKIFENVKKSIILSDIEEKNNNKI